MEIETERASGNSGGEGGSRRGLQKAEAAAAAVSRAVGSVTGSSRWSMDFTDCLWRMARAGSLDFDDSLERSKNSSVAKSSVIDQSPVS